MAEKPMSNFKTAVNELMNGKIKTDDMPDAPVFESSDFVTTPPSYSPAASENQPSVFASDLIIEGTVKAKSDIKLNGYIKGDVNCGGSIISTGTIDGNIDCTNVILNGSTVTGNINVRNSVTMDNNSSVTGDIVASALVSDGKIKGNVILKESISLRANASIHGNVKAKTIAIESGTTLVGNIEIKSTMTSSDSSSVYTPASTSASAYAPASAPAPSSTPAQSFVPDREVLEPDTESAPPTGTIADLIAKNEALKDSIAKRDAEKDD